MTRWRPSASGSSCCSCPQYHFCIVPFCAGRPSQIGSWIRVCPNRPRGLHAAWVAAIDVTGVLHDAAKQGLGGSPGDLLA